MRRLLLPSVLVTVLCGALAAVALAATPRVGTYRAAKGAVQHGKDLSFKVDQKGRRIANVVAHVTERCGSSQDVTTVGPGFTWAVKNGRFSARREVKSSALTLITTLTGRFTSRTRAVGTIRQQSKIAGVSCDTGTLKFTATRR
jgi:hypothetical protein